MEIKEKRAAPRRDVLCQSILGREIPVYTLGSGKRAVLYVGAHRGTDALIGAVLEDFVRELGEAAARGATLFDRSVADLLERRRIVVVPTLNPDGAAYVREGVRAENPLAPRLLPLLDAGTACWEANARGVALDKNYSTGFAAARMAAYAAGVVSAHPSLWCGEYPESEPESAALARLARGLGSDLQGVLELGCGRDEITCSCSHKLAAKSRAAGRILARTTGLSFAEPATTPPAGHFADWCLEELSRPAYRVTVAPPKDATPLRARALLFERLYRALVHFPFMV